MMLRGNLATRPFYNERIVSLVLALIGAVVLALTVINATRLIQLSSRRSELRAQIAADEAAAARIRQGAAAIQKGVDRAALVSLAGSAREANALIDERTFSWTTLLSLIETNIPMGVRLTSITPAFIKGDIVLTMMLIGRQAEDVTQFMEALEKTGSFYDVNLTTANTNEEGLDLVTLKARYLPPLVPTTTKPAEVEGR
jgi:Tfp pilus assembly protein PilN